MALVNAMAGRPVGPAEPQPGLRDVLVEHGYLAGRAPASVEPALRRWALRLRTVFEAVDLDAAAAAVNALLADVVIGPHLSGHDGQRWHLHYTPPEASLVDRVRSTTAFALAMLVSEYGTDRHGVCAAEGCSRVYADTSRNAARRYCSPACANRSAVAAHRARARMRGTTGTTGRLSPGPAADGDQSDR
ncbi:CGNR zinc finger domain-containing protein [Pseudonocardia asaccharolytica]|uniref:CGNR zinc finger domain-containing protein n=1 Tax=Pseudonocardia asaccharolytica TaxID=54010 RepID=UPI0013765318|nr:CGNR zinc finger domain-containing protein [Pseudonocardia asaccharolytica]